MADVERTIVGFHQDVEGNWVADLDCGHRQHLYHRPPFQLRSWVLTEQGRSSRLGSALSCRLCDRAELPDRVRLLRTSPVWDRSSMPEGLGRRHRLPAGTWGLLTVIEGELEVRLWTTPPTSQVLPAGASLVLAPLVDHRVEGTRSARFVLDFLSVEPPIGDEVESDPEDLGGDPACWAQLVCPGCGAMLPGMHRSGCEEGG